MSDGNTVLNFPPTVVSKCHICGDTTDYKIQQACKKCGLPYCTEHASKYDPMYCEHCVFAVSIVEEDYRREDVHEDYDEVTDTVVKTVTKTPVAHKIQINGVDWVFLNNVIHTKTEEELRLQLKFYKAAVSAMEMELTQRVVKRITTQHQSIGSGVSTKTSTTTKTKKTTRAAKPIDLSKLAEQLKGLTPEQIKALFG